MFAGRFFAAAYFAPRYFAEVGATPTPAHAIYRSDLSPDGSSLYNGTAGGPSDIYRGSTGGSGKVYR